MTDSIIQKVIVDQESAVMSMLNDTKPSFQANQLVELLQVHFGNRKITGVEIGTLQGATLSYVVENCPNVTMIAIDVAPIMDMFRTKTSRFEDRVLLLVTRSDCAIKHWHNLGMGKVDFVWIDADHEYRQVKRDIDNYLPIVKDGGIIGGHDYHCSRALGVAQAVDEAFSKDMLRLGRDLTWWVYKDDIKV